MSHEEEHRPFSMPASLVTQSDLRRLIVEVETIDGALVTESIHQRTGYEGDEQITLSSTLGECVEANSVDIRDQSARSQLLAELKHLKEHAPVVHMTFAATAKREVLAKLVGWLREKVDPQAIIEVGLQPDLIGGAHIRTTNKVFDMSIRAQLADSRSVIVKELEALRGVS